MKKKKTALTLKIVPEGCSSKTLVEFECFSCGMKYEKETFVPSDSMKDLHACKNIGFCKKCSADNFSEDILVEKINKKLKEIKNDIDKNGSNEFLLL